MLEWNLIIQLKTIGYRLSDQFYEDIFKRIPNQQAASDRNNPILPNTYTFDNFIYLCFKIQVLGIILKPLLLVYKSRIRFLAA